MAGCDEQRGDDGGEGEEVAHGGGRLPPSGAQRVDGGADRREREEAGEQEESHEGEREHEHAAMMPWE